MPISLTTPVSVGSLDPGAENGQYTQVRICNLEFDFIQKSIALRCVYGNTVGGIWKSGIKQLRVGIQNMEPHHDENGNLVENSGTTNYDDVVSLLPVDGTTPLYTQVGDTLYQWLIDEGHFAGTVVP